jgi:hypothetical protein
MQAKGLQIVVFVSWFCWGIACKKCQSNRTSLGSLIACCFSEGLDTRMVGGLFGGARAFNLKITINYSKQKAFNTPVIFGSRFIRFGRTKGIGFLKIYLGTCISVGNALILQSNSVIPR